MAHEIARGIEIVETVGQARRRSLTRQGYRTRHRRNLAALAGERFQQRRQARLALAFQHAIDRALGVPQDRARGERRAVAADQYEAFGQQAFRQFRQIDDLGQIGEIISRERDDVRSPCRHRAGEARGRVGLQVHQPDFVAALARTSRHQLEPQRLEPEKHLRIHQRAGMDREELHWLPGQGRFAP